MEPLNDQDCLHELANARAQILALHRQLSLAVETVDRLAKRRCSEAERVNAVMWAGRVRDALARFSRREGTLSA